jgi:hypothetical protein
VDVSVKRYFPTGEYISLAGYYKTLTDFVNPQRNLPLDFAQAAATLPAQPTRDHARRRLAATQRWLRFA